MNWKIIHFLFQKKTDIPPQAAVKKERTVKVKTGSLTPVSEPVEEPQVQEPALQQHQRFIELDVHLRINLKGIERVLIPFQPAKQPSEKKPISAPPLTPAPTKTKPVSSPKNAWGIIAAAGLAFLGQMLLSQKQIIPGIIFYTMALIAFLIWGVRGKSNQAFSFFNKPQPEIKPRLEWVLIVLILLFAAAARFYRITERPYGLEGDGVGAVVQSFFTHVLQEPGGDFGFHLESLPVSFFLQGLFMRVFGVSVLTSRYLSALMGTLSVFFFYGTVRRLAGAKTALVAALFYASSYLMLNASRQTLIETQIELWVLLSYWLTTEAIFTKKTWFYFLAGLTSLIGMLTYESFYMTPVVLGLFLLADAWKNKKQWKSTLLNLGLFILPLLTCIPSTLDYIQMRQGYHFEAYNFTVNQNGSSLSSSLAFWGERFLFSLETLFVRVHWTDSLLNWMGTFVNPLLMPFSVLGMVIAFRNPRKQYLWLFGAWFLLQYFPFGILGGTFPRVFFPSAPALFALSAMGLMEFVHAISALLSSRPNFWRTVLKTAVPAAFVLIVALFDLNIFWNVLFDPDERHKRRELAEFVSQTAADFNHTLFPYATYANEVPRQEANLIRMTFYGANHGQDVQTGYGYVPYHELLSTFTNGTQVGTTPTAIIIDRSDSAFLGIQDQAWHAIQQCLPQSGLVTEGSFFNIYEVIPAESPACYSKEAYNLVSPEPDQHLSASEPIAFTWLSDYPASTQAQVWVEQKKPEVIWIEAEDFPRNATWHDMREMATDYSGEAFIVDDWQSQPISLAVDIDAGGSYTLWVRSYRRMDNDQVNYIQINTAQPLAFSEMTKDLYNQWVWESPGTFSMSEGENLLTLSRTYDTDPQFSVFVDAIVLTTQDSFNPETDSAWNEPMRSEQIPASIGTLPFEQPFTAGEYRWYLYLEDDSQLVDWQGRVGLLSEPVYFSIQQ